MMENPMTCPACGGSGGGPFGPPGLAWDVESYECPRCRSAGVVPRAGSRALLGRPLAKGLDSSRRQRARGQPRRSEDEASSRKASDAPCRLRPGVTRASRTSAAAEHAVSVVARSGGAAAARAPADPEGIRARSGTHATHADRASTRPHTHRPRGLRSTRAPRSPRTRGAVEAAPAATAARRLRPTGQPQTTPPRVRAGSEGFVAARESRPVGALDHKWPGHRCPQSESADQVPTRSRSIARGRPEIWGLEP